MSANPNLFGLAAAFALFLIVFRLLELTRPRHRRLALLRPGFLLDLSYWLFTPLVTKWISRAAVITITVPLALLVYGRVDAGDIANGYGPASKLPLWIQAAAIMMIGDFCGYWMHRIFHHGRLWRFHAIHHSPTALDWLSALRVHPVNDALMRIATTLPLLALGFAPVAVVSVIPVLTVMAIVVHANLDWDWGPLRTVLVSPRFHRWHHADDDAARGKNFAGLFPLWDILFRTYYMPARMAPQRFGTDLAVPENLWRQLVFPFASR